MGKIEEAPRLFDPETVAEEPDYDRDLFDYAPTGRFSGHAATDTERAAGDAVELADRGPLRKGSASHQVLAVYGATEGVLLTAYEASLLACGDYHGRRREATRLLTRGFLVKDGTLPNPAPTSGGRAVDAYRITDAGAAELDRLGEP